MLQKQIIPINRKSYEHGATTLECGILAALIMLVTVVALPGEDIACALEDARNLVHQGADQDSYNCNVIQEARRGDTRLEESRDQQTAVSPNPQDNNEEDAGPSIVLIRHE